MIVIPAAHTESGREQSRQVMGVDPCRCTASWLPPEQARAGGIACTWCGLPVMRDGRQMVMTAEVAAQVAPFLEAGGEAVLIPALGRVVYIPPDQVVQPPGRAHIAECPDCHKGVSGAAGRASTARVPAGRSGGPAPGAATPRCSASWTTARGCTAEACSADWGPDYPGWLAQRLPERLVTRSRAASDLRQIRS